MAAWRSKDRVVCCPCNKNSSGKMKEEKTLTCWKIGHQSRNVRRSSYGLYSQTQRGMEGRQWCHAKRCGCGTSAKIPSSARRSSVSVTDLAEIWLAGHTCLLCHPRELELAFLLVTALHRNAVVLWASSGVFNTLLCRQAGYLTPICFFSWVIYSSGCRTVSENESMC